jgi:hypothetical protein
MSGRMKVLITLLPLVLTVYACGGGSEPSTTCSIQGFYDLRTVNGANLPWVITQTETGAVELTGNELSLDDNGTTGGHFNSQSYVQTTTGLQIISESGNYTRASTPHNLVYPADFRFEANFHFDSNDSNVPMILTCGTITSSSYNGVADIFIYLKRAVNPFGG